MVMIGPNKIMRRSTMAVQSVSSVPIFFVTMLLLIGTSVTTSMATFIDNETLYMTAIDHRNSSVFLNFGTSVWRRATMANNDTSSSSSSPHTTNNHRNTIKIGLLNGDSSFFDPIEVGFKHACKAAFTATEKILSAGGGTNDDDNDNTNHLQVECYYGRTPANWSSVVSSRPFDKCDYKRLVTEHWVYDLGLDAVALTPCGRSTEQDAYITQLERNGVPIITFDRDAAPNTTRTAYVGTDQAFMGRTLARLLKQLRPEGGTFGLVAAKKGRTEGFVAEITKDNVRDDRAHWYQIDDVEYTGGGAPGYMKMIDEYVSQHNATAIVSLRQTPMKATNWTDVVDKYRMNPANEEVTFLGVDGSDFQLAYLNQKYVDGLVGQLPWDIGSKVVDVMIEAIKNRRLPGQQQQQTEQQVFDNGIIPTNLVAYNLIPLELPQLDVDQNLLGNLKFVGLVCFGIVALSVIVCIGWTIKHHKTSLVVAAAQPFFLVVVATGVLIMASTLIPLSWDDNGQPSEVSDTTARAVCQSIPWLCFVGFAITFSALFSKTWRVNKLVNKSSAFGKTQIKARDVLLPFAIVLVLNLTVLIVWTVIDPLTYSRQFEDGTDLWNRELESVGRCKSEHATAFLVPLALINFVVVLIACWQAIRARNIKSEFSESKFIFLAVMSMTQSFLTGIPIVALVRNIPQAFYLVLTFLIFLLSMIVLLLIFLPKMMMQRKYSLLPKSEQKKMMVLAISIKRSQRSSEITPSGEFASGMLSGNGGSSTRFGLAPNNHRRISGLHYNIGENMSANSRRINSSSNGDGGEDSSSNFRLPISGTTRDGSLPRNKPNSSIRIATSSHNRNESSGGTTMESSSTSRVVQDDVDVMTSIAENENSSEESDTPATTGFPPSPSSSVDITSKTDTSMTHESTQDGSRNQDIESVDMKSTSSIDLRNSEPSESKLKRNDDATALFCKMIAVSVAQDSSSGLSKFHQFLKQVDRSALSSDTERSAFDHVMTLFASTLSSDKPDAGLQHPSLRTCVEFLQQVDRSALSSETEIRALDEARQVFHQYLFESWAHYDQEDGVISA